jgi:ABC-type Fe3+ transport system permease subunit
VNETIGQSSQSPAEQQPRTVPGLVSRYWWAAALVIAAVVVILASSFASADPDGLERVAEDKGFIDTAQGASYEIIPDYTVPGIDGTISTILAGIIGIAIVFGVMLLVGRLVARRRATRS